jgi:hypothetical protein
VQCHFDDADRPQFIRLHIVREEVIASWGSHATWQDKN